MIRRLSTGGTNDPFLPRLLATIRQADQVDLAVAFIKRSGLDLLFDALRETIEDRGGRLRVLTSDYLDVTDPAALRQLMLLAERGADVRLFEAGDQSFHLKTYICVQSQDGRETWGSAFVGSSNISRTALTNGLEWNFQIEKFGTEADAVPCAQELREIRAAYQVLFDDSRARHLNHAWIDAYEKRRRVFQRLPVAPDADEPEEPPPQPTEVQEEALAALAKSRDAGYQRGLVVMATGLGKTYLAAFDSVRMQAKRVLFVAHREEILLQAEASFQRVWPRARVGLYTGTQKDADADLLFASVQTLAKKRHLDAFAPDRFEYIVIDEFHHAAARTYRLLLQHFRPRFLLGLTATPERSDQSDILSLCDDNLVYARGLFEGVGLGLLSPFHYHGIYDETVDYQAIPWRNGRFDPEDLSNKLATLGRARHALNQWHERAQQRTLAFCVSVRHADFMAEHFRREGIEAAAVYQGSDLARGEALEQLQSGRLRIIFSVDLFNEGVDLPAIDTVMMLRPTESKILFLQQLGRGLRRHAGKDHLVVLDFIGNHTGFLNKPQALFGVGSSYRELAEFARRARDERLDLPPGCYANYDLAVIDFLTRLKGRGPAADYDALKESLGRRPTLSEYFRSGSKIASVRAPHGQWWGLIRDQGDISPAEAACLERHGDFLREIETTSMTKSFKAVLLESLLDMGGFRAPPKVEDLADQAQGVFRRRRAFVSDIRSDLRNLDAVPSPKWLKYWKDNPVNAWTGGNRRTGAKRWFELRDGRFSASFDVTADESDTFESMVQELLDYRFAAYEPRLSPSPEVSPETEPLQDREAGQPTPEAGNVIPFPQHPEQSPAPLSDAAKIPYFPDLRIACGHFRSGRTGAEQSCTIAPGHGRLDPSRHFVARAIGDSMNGGKHPVQDGDYLLLEMLDPEHAGSINGSTMVIERQDTSGDDQYLLRLITKTPEGRYLLKAANPEYPDFEADDNMRTLARLKSILSPEEVSRTEGNPFE